MAYGENSVFNKRLADIGRYRGNPKGFVGNTLRFPKNTTGTVGLDQLVLAIANTATVTAYRYDGVDYTLPAGLTLQNPKAVRDAIHGSNHTSSVAWDPYSDQAAKHTASLNTINSKEVNSVLTVKHDGTNVTIRHIGEGRLESVTIGGTVRAMAAKKTTVEGFCDYVIELVGDAPALTINGVDRALADAPFPYAAALVADNTTAAELKANLEAACTASVATIPALTGFKVSVSVNRKLGKFSVKINAVTGITFELSGRTLLAQNFGERFV